MRMFLVAAAALFAVAVINAENHTAQNKKQPEIAFQIADFGPDSIDFGTIDAWQVVCEPIPRSSEDISRPTPCYMRYVDQIRSDFPRYMLAARIYTNEQGMTVDFGLTGHLRFAGRGLRLVKDGFVIWKNDSETCLSENRCLFTGPAAATLVNAFSDKNARSIRLTVDIDDSSGEPGVREWQMEPFAAQYDNFLAAL
jgi:hypothetical protein